MNVKAIISDRAQSTEHRAQSISAFICVPCNFISIKEAAYAGGRVSPPVYAAFRMKKERQVNL